MLGGAAFLGVYFWIGHSAEQAQRQAKTWLDRTPSALSPGVQGPVHSPRRPHRGEVIGELDIPRLHVSVAVFEGADSGILRLGAGHISRTALPEEAGNVGIAAHRDTFFRPLRRIRPQDVIELKTAAGILHYTVTDVSIVTPKDIQVLASAPGQDLTLVTCYPFYYVGHAPRRFIVHARRTIS